MRPDVAEKLRDASDFYALTKGVLALCEPFGPLNSFRFVHSRGAASVACFIELESPRQQPGLARALGSRTLSGSVCMEIPVRRDFASQGKVVALASPAASFEPRLPQSAAHAAANSQASR